MSTSKINLAMQQDMTSSIADRQGARDRLWSARTEPTRHWERRQRHAKTARGNLYEWLCYQL